MQDIAALYKTHLDRLTQGYEAAMAKHQLDAIVIGSGQAAAKNRFDDQFWPLSVTPAFAHWLPLCEPDCFLIIRPGKKPTLLRSVVDDYWHSKAPLDSEHFLPFFDIVEIKPGGHQAHFPVLRCGLISRDPLGLTGGSINAPDLVATLDALRTQKTDYEVHCLTEATIRAVAGHRAVEKSFLESDKSELALQLAYLAGSDQDDAQTPYKNIVALGPHAAVLHHVEYGKKPVGRTDTSCLLDAGAKYLGYCSDITRTFTRGGGAAARQFSSLVAAVDGVQRKLVEQLRPGLEYEALHDQSHFLLAAALEEIGLLRGTVEECVAKGITRALFPHGLGHSLGLITHDVGCKPRAPKPENKYLRTTTTVAAGQVFTIEPGVYFIDTLLAPLRNDDRAKLVNWQLVDVLKPFGGVRIEDNIVVYHEGVRNLTREAFAPPGSAPSNRIPRFASTEVGSGPVRSGSNAIPTPVPTQSGNSGATSRTTASTQAVNLDDDDFI